MPKVETERTLDLNELIERWKALGLFDVAARVRSKIGEGEEPRVVDVLEVPDPDESPAKVALAVQHMGDTLARTEFTDLRMRDLGTPGSVLDLLIQQYCGRPLR